MPFFAEKRKKGRALPHHAGAPLILYAAACGGKDRLTDIYVLLEARIQRMQAQDVALVDLRDLVPARFGVEPAAEGMPRFGDGCKFYLFRTGDPARICLPVTADTAAKRAAGTSVSGV